MLLMCLISDVCTFDVDIVVICSVVAVFFFKQKTAYEMRISDWSSDVCSSDLGGISLACTAMLAQELLERSGVGILDDKAVSGLVQQMGHGEIGRASCRERVCQYV